MKPQRGGTSRLLAGGTPPIYDSLWCPKENELSRPRRTGPDDEPVASTDQHSWTTEDEKNWLLRLGDTARDVKRLHTDGIRTRPIPTKEALLRSYLQTAPWRAEWGDVNPKAAVAYARELLGRAEVRATSR